MISFWIVLFIVLLTAFGLCFAYDLSKVGGRSFATIKHLLREYFWSKNSILYYAVIALLGIAIFNHRLWTGEILLNWWRKGYGSIGDQTFFPVEEWLALHSHNNEWPVFVGYVTVIIVIIVLHSLSRKIRIHGFGHALFIFALIACFLGTMPCLCRTKERMHRQFCPYNQRHINRNLKKKLPHVMLTRHCRRILRAGSGQKSNIFIQARIGNPQQSDSSSLRMHPVPMPETFVTVSGRTERLIFIIHGNRKEAVSDFYV